MLFKKINITNQKPLKVQEPQSWDDVTFKQFRDIQKESDSLGRLSILTGIPVDFFNKYPDLADYYVYLEHNMSWSNEWDDSKSSGEVFILDNETFSFPKDVGMLSVGLYKDIQNEAQENKDSILDIYPLICASYYQVLRDGEYDYKKASGLVEVFENQPCVKVYNAASFFLNKVQGLRNGTKVGLKSQVIRMTRKWLGLIGLRKFSGLKLHRHN